MPRLIVNQLFTFLVNFITFFTFQLFFFLFAPILLPIYVISLPIVGIVFFFRRRYCHKKKKITLRDLYKRIWGPEGNGSDRIDPDGLDRLALALGEHINQQLDDKFDSMLAKFQRFSLGGPNSKSVKPPKVSESPLANTSATFVNELHDSVPMQNMSGRSELNGPMSTFNQSR